MNCNELYKLTPIKVSRELYKLDPFVETAQRLDYYMFEDSKNLETYENNPRIECRTLEDPYIDGTRGWELFTVWFDGVPCMVCQHAGRSMQDFKRYFVSDVDTYLKMVAYLHSLEILEWDEDTVIDPTVDMEELTNFYGGKFTPGAD